MKGSQGLEALAALCGGQSDAPTAGGRAANSTGSKSHETMSAVSRVSNGHGAQQVQAVQDSRLQQGQRQNPLSTQQSPLQNISQQQWQQAIAAAAALQGGGMNPALAAQSFLLQSGLSPHQGLGDNSMAAMQQQMALQQFIQTQAKLNAHQAAQSLGGTKPVGYPDQNQQVIMMALAQAGNTQALQQMHGAAHELPTPSQQQVIPSAPNSTQASALATTESTGTAAKSSPAQASMKPPPPPSQGVQSLPSTLSTAGILNQGTASNPAIAPMPGGKILPNGENTQVVVNTSNKKQQKRAANRRSAQLSRKRKKQFIEELKEENDELRRKEQILRSIPDLIVVFDSSGKLGFVSESVSRFIDIDPEDLEGSSFWDRLCEDSVRLLKAAFMDSLAARQPDSETAALGTGVWELRLVDKDLNYTIVTLNGVVHFSGEAPECVCCIRPRDQQPIRKLPKQKSTAVNKAAAVSSSDGSRSSAGSSRDHPQIPVHPSQSVIRTATQTTEEANRKKPRREMGDLPIASARQAVRISDGDSGCDVSESGSDDGIASN